MSQKILVVDDERSITNLLDPEGVRGVGYRLERPRFVP